MQKVIRVIEFDEIKSGSTYDGIKFNQKDLLALQEFNSKTFNKYYTLTNRGVKFQQYVGIIQIGNLTIEILPKSDKSYTKDSGEEIKQDLKDILIEMIKASGFFSVHSLTNAHQKLRKASLLDIYIEYFLNEVELLLHKGLSKKYRFIENNLNVLKGRIQFAQHIDKNLFHRERFYTYHEVYDYSHTLNQILVIALNILSKASNNPVHLDKIGRLRLNFPEIQLGRISEDTFLRIIYNRKTEHYKKAIDIAKLIILNYNPDIQAGKEDILAILFDMNVLWERFIFKQLQKNQKEGNYTVEYQNSKRFWKSRTIRPDLIIKMNNETYVVDTKWKVLSSLKPADDDLKQMFAYNLCWEANSSLLLYPDVYGLANSDGQFAKQNYIPIGRDQANLTDHFCKLCFVKVWKKENNRTILNKDIWSQIVEQL